jgi:hypothetical protein
MAPPRTVIQTAGANVNAARTALAANLLAQKQQQSAKTAEEVLKLQQEQLLVAQNRTKEQVRFGWLCQVVVAFVCCFFFCCFIFFCCFFFLVWRAYYSETCAVTSSKIRSPHLVPVVLLFFREIYTIK